MSSIEIGPLKFKGSRDYLQGPDIYNALVQSLFVHGISGIENLELNFHSLARTQLVGLMDVTERSSGIYGVCRFTVQGQHHQISLEGSGEPITQRYPYDEDAVTATANCDLDSLAISEADVGKVPASPIETVIALTKLLHVKAFGGKWLFVRLKLERLLPEAIRGNLIIRIGKNLGNKYTCSQIVLNEKALGEIHFALAGKQK